MPMTVRMTRRMFSIFITASSLFAMSLIGCAQQPAQSPAPQPSAQPAPKERVFTESRPLMSTTITLTIAAPDEAVAQGHIRAAFDQLDKLQSELSAHDPKSELATVNAESAARPVKVEQDLFDCISDGVKWFDQTNRTFDITCAPLLKLWRDCGKADRLPQQKELDAARALGGANAVTLDPAALTVQFTKPGMQLDLGGLGKGFCMDRVAQTLRARGVQNALLAGSGDIRAMGRNPEGRPWRVGIQDPRQPENPDAHLAVLALIDKSVSTSGNYQRYVTIQGKRYSHIVDPRTGWTADNVPSVTVIGPDSITTDILDTALSVMGVEEGMKYVEAHPGIEAMFVLFDKNNEPVVTQSKGFGKYLAGWADKPK